MEYQNNRDLMQLQHEYNKYAFAAENEYNKPKYQIERLQEAGINPSTLAMNGGQVVGNNQSASMLPMTPLQTDFGSIFSGLISSLANSRLMNAQAKTEDQMRQVRYENVQKQNNELDARVRGLNASATAQEICNQYAHAREIWSLKKSQSEVSMNLGQRAVYNEQVKRFRYELDNILPADLMKIISETNVNIMSLDEMTAAIADYYSKIDERNQNISESQTRQGLMEEQSKTEQAQQGLLSAETDIKEQESSNYQNITDHVIEQYNKTIDNIAAQTDKTKEETFWMVFDEVEKTSIKLMGSHFSRNRFGERKDRVRFKDALKQKFHERGLDVYNP